MAWSKSGAIATATADRQGVVLQHLICDARDGQWKLSEEYAIEGVAATHGNTKVVHLSWDTSGTLLAVCDLRGRITIYTVALANTAINRMSISRRCNVDPDDDLSTIVGLTWLPNERGPTYFAKSATFKDGRWGFTIMQQSSHGPKYPLGKPVMLVITRKGTAKSIFQDRDGRWQELRTELQPFSRATGFLTHAAFCVDKTKDSGKLPYM